MWIKQKPMEKIVSKDDTMHVIVCIFIHISAYQNPWHCKKRSLRHRKKQTYPSVLLTQKGLRQLPFFGHTEGLFATYRIAVVYGSCRLAKIIRPALVCNALVTTTVV